jgi:hypothetical protein
VQVARPVPPRSVKSDHSVSHQSPRCSRAHLPRPPLRRPRDACGRGRVHRAAATRCHRRPPPRWTSDLLPQRPTARSPCGVTRPRRTSSPLTDSPARPRGLAQQRPNPGAGRPQTAGVRSRGCGGRLLIAVLIVAGDLGVVGVAPLRAVGRLKTYRPFSGATRSAQGLHVWFWTESARERTGRRAPIHSPRRLACFPPRRPCLRHPEGCAAFPRATC